VTSLRRLAFPFWLAGTRLRRRGGPLLLIVLGLAAATAMLAAVLAGTTAAEDREVGRQVAQLPAKVRAVRVNWFSVGGQVAPYSTLDASVRRELRRVSPAHVTGTALYSESQLGGGLIGLGAVDDLGSWVRLRSGRLPRICTPRRCEVLVIRGGGKIPSSPGFRLVPVGEGDLKTAALFGDAVPAERLNQSTFVQHITRYHRPAPPPLVLANGVAALDRLPVLHNSYRSYGWVVPLRHGTVRSWSANALADRIDQARTAFQTGTFGFELTAPTDELRGAADDAHVAGRRLLLLGGAAVSLLLAFAVLVGARQRRDADAVRERLRGLGVRRWQSALVILVESLAAAVVGTVLGWVAGSAAAAAIAGRSGEPVGALLRHSVLTGRGLTIALVVGLAAGLVVALALTIAPVRVGGLAISPLDVAALGAALAVVIALARGSANASELLASNDTGLVLLLLPALVGLAAAVAVARLLPLALRGLERIVPKDALSLRLAALGLARRPGYASVAVAFVVVSVGFALFASTYRSTLETSQREQAAFAVPADEVLSEDLSQLVPVRAVVTPEVERSLGVHTSRVTRLAGNIAGAQVTGITVLGVLRSSLPRIDGWRSDFASEGPSGLARAIDPGRSVALRGPTVPKDARRLSIPLTVRGTLVGLVAYVRARDGAFVPIRLARNEGPRPRVLVARIPPEARGGKLVAFRFDPPPKLIERGANSGGPAVGTVVLGPPRADGRKLTDYGDWTGTTGVAGLTQRGALRFGLTLTNEVDTYVRPRQPTDGLKIPAIVSPLMAELAGPDRTFGVVVAGESLVFRVEAVARRFPGILESQSSDFVVVDQPALAAALNVSSPGFGFPTELWLDTPSSRRAALEAKLRKPPFTALVVSSQSRHEDSLRGEPISRGALAMLEAAAITAVVLALLALVLGAVSERRDEAAELFDLEAQGVAPASLRRQLRLRASMAGLAGALGGAVTGLVLSLLVVRFVELTANATAPEPPLELAPDWPLILAAAVVAAALGAALVLLATHRAFRDRTPARYGEAV
jgi:ABC-type lipoprotein release transport system permease subunit